MSVKTKAQYPRLLHGARDRTSVVNQPVGDSPPNENHLDKTNVGTGMNWDHYAKCRLHDFEQR